jgi:hypothetical protein
LFSLNHGPVKLALVRSEIKVMPEAVVKGELRPLRNPADDPD